MDDAGARRAASSTYCACIISRGECHDQVNEDGSHCQRSRTRWTRVVALVSQALLLCNPRLVCSWWPECARKRWRAGARGLEGRGRRTRALQAQLRRRREASAVPPRRRRCLFSSLIVFMLIACDTLPLLQGQSSRHAPNLHWSEGSSARRCWSDWSWWRGSGSVRSARDPVGKRGGWRPPECVQLQ